MSETNGSLRSLRVQRLFGLSWTVLVGILALVSLWGQASPAVLLVEDWVARGPWGERAAHVPENLGALGNENVGTYGMHAQVVLPIELRGKGLTFSIPLLRASTEVRVNGEPASSLDGTAPATGRLSTPHRYWVRPELTQQGTLDLHVEVYPNSIVGWNWATVPRLSDSVVGDPITLWAHGWNVLLPIVALAVVIVVAWVNIYMPFWNDPKSYWYLLGSEMFAGLMLSSWLGLTEKLFGAADHWMLLVSMAGSAHCLQMFFAMGRGLARFVAWARWGFPIMVMMSVPAMNAFRHWWMVIGLLIGGTLTVQLIVFWESFRIREQGRALGMPWKELAIYLSFGLALLDIGVLGGTPSYTGGLLLSPVSALAILVLFTWIYASEFFLSLEKATLLQATLQERVVQLELRNDEVQVLNGELRRQLMANASELASALVEATRQGRDSLVRSGDLVDGRYKVGRLLGTGAMGAVYEVRRLSDGARFAMKLILGTTSPLAVARLAREAQNALRVSHPHVIAVRDVGMTDEQELFVVMDLAEGSNLGRERDRFGEVDWGLPILRQVAEGLAAIHEAGVVHRDIKPSNIILTTAEDGQPWWARITDFGVSGTAALPERPVDSDTEPNLTRTGHVMGTPRYMAPEAFQDGSKIGPPADMFSFGVLAREVLGVETDPPMVPYGLALATLQEMPLVRVEEVCDELYMELARSLDACLAADPTKRPTARALAKVLEMALAAHPAKGAAQTSMFGVKAG